MSQLDHYIKQLSNALSLSEAEAEEDNGYTLKIGPDFVTVWHIDSTSEICFKMDICTLPDRDTEKVMGEILEAGLFGILLGPCIFALNQSSKALFLLLKISDVANYHEFYESLELFMNKASFWKEKILSENFQ